MAAPEVTDLDKATNYLLKNKRELEGFLSEGLIELTNNGAEKTVKSFVIARKNFLFSDT